MSGTVSALYIGPEHGGPKRSIDSAELVAGTGMIGDRHAGENGGVVSIIEADSIERLNGETGLQITAADTGRNIETRGVDLNALVGARFELGEALLECFELCEPCVSLGARLSTAGVSAPDIVKALAHGAGIRARVIRGGSIRVGDPVGN